MPAMSATAGWARALVRLGRALVATALCAQLAHAVVYGSLFPAGGTHAYLSWYVPLVSVLSAGALALVPISIALHAVTGISARAFLPERTPGSAVGDITRLAFSAATFFAVQESIERGASSGAFHGATFSPLTLVVAALALVLAAATVVAVERTLDRLGEPRRAVVPRRRVANEPWTATAVRLARRRPESTHGGLRAPPLAV
jgi:hypothetical protein